MVWNHGILCFSVQLGMSSSQLLLTPSFFRGVGWNHQPDDTLFIPLIIPESLHNPYINPFLSRQIIINYMDSVEIHQLFNGDLSTISIGLSKNVGYIPNEIAIFLRDNDQQNHWVQWGLAYFQTHPYGQLFNGWIPEISGIPRLQEDVSRPSKRPKHGGHGDHGDHGHGDGHGHGDHGHGGEETKFRHDTGVGTCSCLVEQMGQELMWYLIRGWIGV